MDTTDQNPVLPDHGPNDRRLTNPTTEEMREYYEQRQLPLIRVGTTWMFGSGN